MIRLYRFVLVFIITFLSLSIHSQITFIKSYYQDSSTSIKEYYEGYFSEQDTIKHGDYKRL